MLELNLPRYAYKLKRDGDSVSIFDPLRRKYVTLTPEEWVRQHFVSFLISCKKYPAGRMGNEISLVVNRQKRRCDTIVYNGRGEPMAIVEYKAPQVAITQSVFDQIVRYNMVLKVKYLMVSNGLRHYACRINYTDNSYEFLKDIPSYEE